MTNHDRLEIKKPLLFLLSFIAVVGIIFFGLTQIDNSRKDQVYQRYAQETNQFIEKNHTGLVKLFTEVFPNEVCNYTYKTSTADTCNHPSANDIANLTTQELKDWSSTAFIKKVDGDIIVMRLNGETYNFRFNYDEKNLKQTNVESLLTGAKSEIPWDDYTYDFTNKEVIIPVKDTQGNVIGAIMRGVIE
jgi:hypothetical protein